MDKREGQLLEYYQSLTGSAQRMLLNYAEFLCTQPENVQIKDRSLQQPKEITAAENESVVAAIKRLSECYFMLDRAKLLNSASVLMAQHVMQGRDASDVVKELETSFADAYQLYSQSLENEIATDKE